MLYSTTFTYMSSQISYCLDYNRYLICIKIKYSDSLHLILYFFKFVWAILGPIKTFLLLFYPSQNNLKNIFHIRENWVLTSIYASKIYSSNKLSLIEHFFYVGTLQISFNFHKNLFSMCYSHFYIQGNWRSGRLSIFPGTHRW